MFLLGLSKGWVFFSFCISHDAFACICVHRLWRTKGRVVMSLMFLNRRVAQGQQNASRLISLQISSSLALRVEWMIWNERGLSIYPVQLPLFMMDEHVHLCVPVEHPPTFVTGETRLVREGGGRRRQSTGEGGGGRDGKREAGRGVGRGVRHTVASILF